MIKSIVFCLLTALLPAYGCPGGRYLEVTLWDAFGDGWGDAVWLLVDPSESVSTVELGCDDQEKSFTISPSDFSPFSGNYTMTVTTPDDIAPSNWWEIYWKVEEFDASGASTGTYFEGTYDSVMVWTYSCDGGATSSPTLAPTFAPTVANRRLTDSEYRQLTVTDDWELSSASDLPDFSCDGCSGGECEKKGKKKASSSSSKKGPRKGKNGGKKRDRGGKNGPRLLHHRNTTRNSNTSSSSFSYGRRNTDLSVKMFAEDYKSKSKKKQSCDGWEDVTVIGAHWYIADATQSYLFEDGSLCDGCAGKCDICLGDGSYVFRVTGPNQNYTDNYRANDKVWEFCNARGNFNDQMNFHIKKGKCYPNDLRWSSEICDDIQESMVELTGVVALLGMSSELMRNGAADIVLETLANTVSGWNAKDMSVTGTSLGVRSLTDTARSLTSFSHEISFSVTFIAEEYEVNGANYAAIENLLADMASTLEASFSSGVFTDYLKQEATTLGVDALSDVQSVELVSLEISSVQYAHSHLVYYYGDDSETVQENDGTWSTSVSSTIILAFMSVSALGFIAFVGIAHHGIRAYQTVSTSTDSEQASIAERQAAVRTPFGASTTKYRPVANGGLKI